ncbi:FecR family protein [Butyricimonas hominis]|uniref:FecR domain-containing protein n=1 Tax=Butyricimonas hominis TaxID=2763032 RepID=A0ABR7D6P7_9BACT|nr:FecR domain-containing protein [Butyricimonas hominis]MBC5623621.1 FecR domain-containing protein [Butyricimonas hominis]
MREIEDILVDYFGDEELSASDSVKLEKWLQEGDDARIVQVLDGMRVGKTLQEELERDAEAGMEVIRRRWRRRNRRRNLWYGGAVAAVALLLIGLTFLFKSPVKEKKVNIFADDCTLVTLKLDNGKVLPLRAGQINEVIVKDSFSRIENDNSTLICTNDGGKEENEEVAYHTITVPAGAEYRVLLADGTTVHLNADSEFRFPEAFSGKNREVYLKGEGYFEVAKDSAKRFIVHALNMDATVLGTSFNIKAYPEQDEIIATLEEGRLQVDCDHDQRFELQAGHQVVFSKVTGNAEKKSVTTMYYTSWKDGFYCFNGEVLENIMEVLAKWYGLEVFYMDEALKNNKFSGRLKRYDDFLYLLDKFEETGNVEFIIKDKVITVKRKTGWK